MSFPVKSIEAMCWLSAMNSAKATAPEIACQITNYNLSDNSY